MNKKYLEEKKELEAYLKTKPEGKYTWSDKYNDWVHDKTGELLCSNKIVHDVKQGKRQTN